MCLERLPPFLSDHYLAPFLRATVGKSVIGFNGMKLGAMSVANGAASVAGRQLNVQLNVVASWLCVAREAIQLTHGRSPQVHVDFKLS